MSYVPTVGTKVCRRCGEPRDVTDFRIFSKYGQDDRTYRRSWCVTCDREYAKGWRERHPGYHKEWSRGYRAL